jgi:hypothetical protein
MFFVSSNYVAFPSKRSEGGVGAAGVQGGRRESNMARSPLSHAKEAPFHLQFEANLSKIKVIFAAFNCRNKFFPRLFHIKVK